jgi:hypothetical protein
MPLLRFVHGLTHLRRLIVQSNVYLEESDVLAVASLHSLQELDLFATEEPQERVAHLLTHGVAPLEHLHTFGLRAHKFCGPSKDEQQQVFINPGIRKLTLCIKAITPVLATQMQSVVNLYLEAPYKLDLHHFLFKHAWRLESVWLYYATNADVFALLTACPRIRNITLPHAKERIPIAEFCKVVKVHKTLCLFQGYFGDYDDNETWDELERVSPCSVLVQPIESSCFPKQAKE